MAHMIRLGGRYRRYLRRRSCSVYSFDGAEIDHEWPKGSANMPKRSPQNWSSSCMTISAPASTARLHHLSGSSTRKARVTLAGGGGFTDWPYSGKASQRKRSQPLTL